MRVAALARFLLLPGENRVLECIATANIGGPMMRTGLARATIAAALLPHTMGPMTARTSIAAITIAAAIPVGFSRPGVFIADLG